MLPTSVGHSLFLIPHIGLSSFWRTTANCSRSQSRCVPIKSLDECSVFGSFAAAAEDGYNYTDSRRGSGSKENKDGLSSAYDGVCALG